MKGKVYMHEKQCEQHLILGLWYSDHPLRPEGPDAIFIQVLFSSKFHQYSNSLHVKGQNLYVKASFLLLLLLLLPKII